jgi:hypothetical protein
MKLKQYTFAILSIGLGIISLLAAGNAVFYIVGDILAGAFSGRAETGWGFLLALLYLLPIAVGTFLAARFFAIKYRQQTGRTAKPLIIISVVLTLALAIGLTILDSQNGPIKLPHNTKDDTTRINIGETISRVTSFYYKSGAHIMPTTSQITVAAGTTYRPIDAHTFEVCATFITDTLSPYKARVANPDALWKKVATNATISGTNVLEMPHYHRAGLQCYNVDVSN